MQRKGTQNRQFIKRIPADVLPRLVGRKLAIPVGEAGFRHVTISAGTQAIRFSHGSADPATVKTQHAEASAYVERVFEAVRKDAPVRLTPRQATALAGQLYRAWVSEDGREREQALSVTMDLESGDWGPVERRTGGLPHDEAEAIYEATIAYLDRLKAQDADLEPVLGAIIDRLSLKVGIGAVDAESRIIVLDAFWLALRDAMEVRRRNAAGDYSPDPKSERFPEFVHPNDTKKPAVTMSGLVEDWWREQKAVGRKPRTYEGYSNTMKKLIAFLGHDDATRVTPDDVVRFKDHRLTTPHPKTGRPASARTVKDADLAGLKSVFGWAVTNRRLRANPAEGITIKLAKAQRLRDRGFTADEAKAILSASMALQRGLHRPESFAAKRWIPWVLAYTGARVGEIAQLRKVDVVETGDHWSIRITPEAGSVKTNSARIVPLHPHLIEQGFVDFVQKAPEGHLFVRPGGRGRKKRMPDPPIRLTKSGKRVLTPPSRSETAEDPNAALTGKLQGLKNHLRDFVRTIVPDPNVQPMHAWRHLFITLCRKHGVDGDIARMITGHSAEDVHAEYGDPAGLYEAVCKLPRFEVE